MASRDLDSTEGGPGTDETAPGLVSTFSPLGRVYRTAETVRAEPERAPVLPNRYEDRGRIAVGAMGEVRRVHDLRLGRDLAMKIVRSDRHAPDRLVRRFLREARVTARLQHPGIVSVHDYGRLEDGRVWFTMREVRGRTFAAVIDELHEARREGGDFATSESGWTLRAALDAFVRACQAVAYAHSEGVVHRDLKPANVMVGAFGEVQVMDWGLALVLDDSDPELAPPGDALDIHRPGDELLTRDGQVLGTPAYMAPEQETHSHHVTPRADVYSLGAILHAILFSRSPRHLAFDALPPRMEGVPPELAEAAFKATSDAPSARHGSASELAAVVRSWIEGTERRERALRLVADADAIVPSVESLRLQAVELRREAELMAEDIQPWDPEDEKHALWALEDEADELERRAGRLVQERIVVLQSALQHDPDNSEAQRRLADHHAAELREAEAAGDDARAERHEAQLTRYAGLEHAALLQGVAALSLVTDPEGAEVVARPYELHRRRWQLGEPIPLGRTPLREASLTKGRYLLEIRAPGRDLVRYPVYLGRGEHHDGVPPEGGSPVAIHLPREGELDPDDVYVPAGWFLAGGDPMAIDSLPSQRLWCDALVVRRFQVTVEDFLAFMNDLAAAGRSEEAERLGPQRIVTHTHGREAPVFLCGPDGTFGLDIQNDIAPWSLDWPVTHIDWSSAFAYARWYSERLEATWRLPMDLEWEKAARGVDGRPWPWGEHYEPTWARTVAGQAGAPSRAPVTSHPLDESPYGVRGVAGNVRDMCGNIYRRGGTPTPGGRVVVEPASTDPLRHMMIKGGGWASVESYCRLAARFGNLPGHRNGQTGFRLVRSYVTGPERR